MPSAALLFTLLINPAAASAAAEDAGTQRYSGFLSPLVDGLEDVLKFFQTGLEALHVPYGYGWSIVLLTISVKLLTFPFTKSQVGAVPPFSLVGWGAPLISCYGVWIAS